jgi:hypothetical protein
MADVHDMSYYKKCMMGGILSCGLTHAAMCPLDIVKCRKQVSLLGELSIIGQSQDVQEHWRWNKGDQSH